MTREIFAQTLQDIIRDSEIRQTVIAQALGLSSAAISQFTHGITLPKVSQLSSLLDLLCVPDRQRMILCRELVSLREQFPESTEEAMDNEDSEEPDNEDDPGLDSYNLERLFSEHTDKENFYVSASEVHGIPVIDLFDLNSLTPGITLFDFANQYLHDTAVRDFGTGCSPVIVKASGDQLGINFFGMLQIVIADDLPLSSSSLVLVRFHNGNYRILPYKEDKLISSSSKLFDEKEFPSGKPEWMAPVLELSMLPAANDLFG